LGMDPDRSASVARNSKALEPANCSFGGAVATRDQRIEHARTSGRISEKIALKSPSPIGPL
jgi:hypothetical protein